jgi:hypothetical protein
VRNARVADPGARGTAGLTVVRTPPTPHLEAQVAHLKSCLQKSIRRRAPLPAVRCALELADKSWGDLLRRLPIIVLEDSTLHLDFGLLVWLMVADSKVRYGACPSSPDQT